MNTIRCSIVEDLLPLYIDGALREETAQAVREHLSACPACRNEYEKLAQTLTLPSAPDLQEEDRRAFQAFRRHWKRKKLQVALLCVVLTAAVVIAGCVVYQEVEVVHDLFSPTTTVVLREAQTHGTWAPVPWEEGDRLRFEGLFAERAVTLDANSDSAVTLRVWDDQHNLVVDELTVAPGEEVSLKTLERNTDYQVEMQTGAVRAGRRGAPCRSSGQRGGRPAAGRPPDQSKTRPGRGPAPDRRHGETCPGSSSRP